MKQLTNKIKDSIRQQPVTPVTIAILICIGFLIGAVWLGGGTDSRERYTGTVDLSELRTEDGELFQQEDYRDKNLVITFTRSTCPYCDEQAFAFEELHDKQDFEHFYIPVNEGYRASKKHFRQLDVPHKILIDSEYKLAKKLEVDSVPTTIIKRAGETEFEAVVGTIGIKEHTKDNPTKQPTMKDFLGN